jgi:NADPH2:quinone reductase
MKAIRVHTFGGPEVLKFEEIADPVPAAGEVLVRVHAAGINPYDTYMRAGTYGANNPALPFTPGSDAAGVIESVGPGAGFSIGQRVYTSATLTGAYAELTLCARNHVHPLADAVTFARGAAVNVPYATAYRSLFQLAHARSGETLLIHGASGGVGIAALQFARAAGMTILATAGSDAGMATLQAEGATHAVNHHDPQFPARIAELTGGRGVDVILEMAAHLNLGTDLGLLAAGGRVVVIGSRGKVEITPRDLMSREASIMGVMQWNVPEEQAVTIHEAISAGLRDGTLRPLVGLELPLAEATAGHRRLTESRPPGKIVLVP